jgi:hypothetical protein
MSIQFIDLFSVTAPVGNESTTPHTTHPFELKQRAPKHSANSTPKSTHPTKPKHVTQIPPVPSHKTQNVTIIKNIYDKKKLHTHDVSTQIYTHPSKPNTLDIIFGVLSEKNNTKFSSKANNYYTDIFPVMYEDEEKKIKLHTHDQRTVSALVKQIAEYIKTYNIQYVIISYSGTDKVSYSMPKYVTQDNTAVWAQIASSDEVLNLINTALNTTFFKHRKEYTVLENNAKSNAIEKIIAELHAIKPGEATPASTSRNTQPVEQTKNNNRTRGRGSVRGRGRGRGAHSGIARFSQKITFFYNIYKKNDPSTKYNSIFTNSKVKKNRLLISFGNGTTTLTSNIKIKGSEITYTQYTIPLYTITGGKVEAIKYEEAELTQLFENLDKYITDNNVDFVLINYTNNNYTTVSTDFKELGPGETEALLKSFRNNTVSNDKNIYRLINEQIYKTFYNKKYILEYNSVDTKNRITASYMNENITPQVTELTRDANANLDAPAQDQDDPVPVNKSTIPTIIVTEPNNHTPDPVPVSAPAPAPDPAPVKENTIPTIGVTGPNNHTPAPDPVPVSAQHQGAPNKEEPPNIKTNSTKTTGHKTSTMVIDWASEPDIAPP